MLSRTWQAGTVASLGVVSGKPLEKGITLRAKQSKPLALVIYLSDQLHHSSRPTYFSPAAWRYLTRTVPGLFLAAYWGFPFHIFPF
jgi:hypothetical protein